MLLTWITAYYTLHIYTYRLYHFQYSLSRHVYTTQTNERRRKKKHLCFVPCNLIFFIIVCYSCCVYSQYCCFMSQCAILFSSPRPASFSISSSSNGNTEYSFTIYCLCLRCSKLNQNIRCRERFLIPTSTIAARISTFRAYTLKYINIP